MARKKRKGKFIKAFFGLVIILAACTYAWLLNERRRTESDLAEIKKLGIPTSIVEYRASYPLAKQGHSKLYDSAVDAWKTIPREDRLRIEELIDRSRENISKNLSAEDKKRLSDVVATTTSLFRKAASTDWAAVSDSAREFQQEGSDKERYKALLNGIKLLALSADQKEPLNSAFNDIFYAGRIAGNSMLAPVGVAEVRRALNLEEEHLRGWQKTLARGTDDPKTIEAADRVLRNMPPVISLPQAFHSAFVDGIWRNDNFNKYVDSIDGVGPKQLSVQDQVYEAFLRSRACQIERKRYFVLEWRDMFERLPKNPEDWRNFKNAAESALNESRTPIELRDGDDIWLLPTVVRRQQEIVAGRRVAIVSLAILQQRLKTGKAPSSLPDLGKESFDPFTGESLIYKRLKKGFMVYSVGPNEKDDGGAPMSISNRQEYDIVQQYP